MITHMESATAKLCSFARAFHSNKGKDRIFDDYLAFDMMGWQDYERTGQLIQNAYRPELFDPACAFDSQCILKQINRYLSPIPLFRAALAEDELEQFAEEHGGCQYVICGAGMDTFAFRNTNPDIEVYELDHPDTQKYKMERIETLEWNIPANVHYVPVDFSKDDMAEELVRAGYEKDRPSFFVILGVTYYLTLPMFENTLERIGVLTEAGSQLAFDFPDDTTFRPERSERVRTLSQLTAYLGEKMCHGYSESELARALSRHGFSILQLLDPEDLQKQFFEGRSDGMEAYENIHYILAARSGD